MEHCEAYYNKATLHMEIEECNGQRTFVLTIMHTTKEPFAILGEVLGGEPVAIGGSTANAVQMPPSL